MSRGGALAFGGIALLISIGVLTASRAPADRTLAADRASALGLLFDGAPSVSSVDRGLAIAEALRRKYGIDTGDPVRDRAAAATRARREILDPLVPEDKQVAEMAAHLGYSLDPGICTNTCANVRELAVLEIKKRALEQFVAN